MSLRDQYIMLFPQGERLEVEKMTRRLSNDDNSLQLWILLMVKRCEESVPKAVVTAITGNLDAARELNGIIGSRSFWLKLVAIVLFTSLFSVGVGILGGIATFRYLAHSLARDVLQEQATRLKEISDASTKLSKNQQIVYDKQVKMSDKQQEFDESQKAIASQITTSGNQVAKTIESAKDVINAEKESAVKTIQQAASEASTLKGVGEAMGLPKSALINYPATGETGLMMQKDSVDIVHVAGSDDQVIVLFHTTTKRK